MLPPPSGDVGCVPAMIEPTVLNDVVNVVSDAQAGAPSHQGHRLLSNEEDNDDSDEDELHECKKRC